MDVKIVSTMFDCTSHINEFVHFLIQLNSRIHTAIFKALIIGLFSTNNDFPYDTPDVQLLNSINVPESYSIYKILINGKIPCFQLLNGVYIPDPNRINEAIRFVYKRAFPKIILGLFGKPIHKSCLYTVYLNSLYDRNIWRLIIRLSKPV